MRPKFRILLALFLAAALLSAWISPAIATYAGRLSPNLPPVVQFQPAIDLLLSGEDEMIYLPLIRR